MSEAVPAPSSQKKQLLTPDGKPYMGTPQQWVWVAVVVVLGAAGFLFLIH